MTTLEEAQREAAYWRMLADLRTEGETSPEPTLEDYCSGPERWDALAEERVLSVRRFSSLPRFAPGLDDLISLEAITAAVAARYEVREVDIQSRRRHADIVLPRQVCMYLARLLTGKTLEAVGAYYGGRDHTTVIYAVEQIGKRLRKELRMVGAVKALVAQLRGA